ncbi:MAG: NADP-dependent malic enzyme [Candidatus Arsenophonus melophagi]|nr:NADP-dependent malic enzyme [Candidatus Arsenophonus melophagi]
MNKKLKQQALDFHEFPQPGKIQITLSKPLTTQQALGLAYSPGVAFPCLEIAKNPLAAYKYTAKGNLVAVVSNGTAVLGLGNIGALAGKPVMEGKGILFKKFSGIDVFDIEIDESNPDKLINVISSLEPTFGGINLEDIKAPECFYIEKKLREKMKIPVFHDDQHGTSIIAAAAILNGLRIVKKKIERVRLVVSGAGAASIACMNLLIRLGLNRSNIIVCDSQGVIYRGRDSKMDETKSRYAIEDNGLRTLADAIPDADIFLGCSAPGVLTAEMVKSMAYAPLILALANPEPEILPSLAKSVRPDAIVCTGRSDYPNQVNNVLCFPFIFRGALDVGASTINEAMKLACVQAIANLVLVKQNDFFILTHEERELQFSADYIIPKPFDPRLLVTIAPAVAKAAMESGVATRPIENLHSYTEKLYEFVYGTNLFMRPIFSLARKQKKRIILVEGEEKRILHAAQELISLGVAHPILIGRTSIIEQQINTLGLQIKIGEDFELINYEYEKDLQIKPYWKKYFQYMQHNGVSHKIARREIINNLTLIGTLMLQENEADCMICGTVGSYHQHFTIIKDTLGLRQNNSIVGTMNALMLPAGNTFIADIYANNNPIPEELAELILMGAQVVRRFGIEPKVLLFSHSGFESSSCLSVKKIRKIFSLIKIADPRLQIEDTMHDRSMLVESSQKDIITDSTLTGTANLLIMPNMEAARMSYNLLRITSSNGVPLGPILMGMAKPVHILTPFVSVRNIITMAALAAAEA